MICLWIALFRSRDSCVLRLLHLQLSPSFLSVVRETTCSQAEPFRLPFFPPCWAASLHTLARIQLRERFILLLHRTLAQNPLRSSRQNSLTPSSMDLHALTEILSRRNSSRMWYSQTIRFGTSAYGPWGAMTLLPSPNCAS